MNFVVIYKKNRQNSNILLYNKFCTQYTVRLHSNTFILSFSTVGLCQRYDMQTQLSPLPITSELWKLSTTLLLIFEWHEFSINPFFMHEIWDHYYYCYNYCQMHFAFHFTSHSLVPLYFTYSLSLSLPLSLSPSPSLSLSLSLSSHRPLPHSHTYKQTENKVTKL